MRKGNSIVSIILLLAILIAGGWYVYYKDPFSLFGTASPGIKGCSQEAMICPDGSAVTRTGTNCEFAECAKPSIAQNDIDVSTWKTYRNEEYGFEVRYPATWMFKARDEVYGADRFEFINKKGYLTRLYIGVPFDEESKKLRPDTLQDVKRTYPSVPFREIQIANEMGFWEGGVACEQGNPCYATIFFYSDKLLQRGIQPSLSIWGLRGEDANRYPGGYDPLSLVQNDLETIETVLNSYQIF